MLFELSEELSSEILFAMENQTGRYVLNSESEKIVELTPESSAEGFYDLPQWSSIQGFQIRERFVHLLGNSPLREKLRIALYSGKNVFKQFKTELKEYPELEKLWLTFKKREMCAVIVEWYNNLREINGLEKIGTEPEDLDLLYEDFVFRESVDDRDAEVLFLSANEALHEIESIYEKPLGKALATLWQKSLFHQESGGEINFVCETISGDFAGNISLGLCAENEPEVLCVCSWFIQPQYRGLGLGGELMRFSLEQIRKKGIQWLILANLVIPDYISKVLFRNGFRQLGSCFVADLCDRGESCVCEQRG